MYVKQPGLPTAPTRCLPPTEGIQMHSSKWSANERNTGCGLPLLSFIIFSSSMNLRSAFRTRSATRPKPPSPTPPIGAPIGRPRLNSSKTRSISEHRRFTTRCAMANPTNRWSTRTPPRRRGKSSRKSKTASRNGFGRMTNGGSGLPKNTIRNSTASVSALSTATT